MSRFAEWKQYDKFKDEKTWPNCDEINVVRGQDASLRQIQGHTAMHSQDVVSD